MTRQKPLPQALRNGDASWPEQTTPSRPRTFREQRKTAHGVHRAPGEPDFRRIAIGHAREERHRDELRRAWVRPHRIARGIEHRSAAGRMDVQHPDAQPGGRPARRCDGIRDVMELQIEKDAEAAPHERLHQCRPCGGEKLVAHLQPALCRVDAIGERERGACASAKSSATITRGLECPCFAASRSPHAGTPFSSVRRGE